MVNSHQLLLSAAVIRIFDIVGISPASIPNIKSPQFKQKSSTLVDGLSVYAGRINIDEKSWVSILFSKNDDAEVLATKIINEDSSVPTNWVFVVCGDISGEDYTANSIIVETGGEHNHVVHMSCYNVYNYLLGFEHVRQYVPTLLPFDAPIEHIEKLAWFISKLELREEDE